MRTKNLILTLNERDPNVHNTLTLAFRKDAFLNVRKHIKKYIVIYKYVASDFPLRFL